MQEDAASNPDDVFINCICGLNIQQKILFQKISTAINREGQRLIFITGSASSGKYFVSKLLAKQVKRCCSPIVDGIIKFNFHCSYLFI